MQKSYQANAPKTAVTMDSSTTTDRTPACNSGFKKLAVQWLIEHSTSHQHLWWLDSFVLRNRQLLKPAKRYQTCKKKERRFLAATLA
ncbi:MAG: hypothetical protein Q7U47_03095 [Paludibacter sp.]|nr:hypothetical protein [Paludibacter sp.]